MSESISVRAYARHRGVSQAAVQKAIRKGRLSESIGEKGGHPVIVDVELADREWESRRARPQSEGRRPTLVPPPVPSTTATPPVPPKDLTYVPIEEERRSEKSSRRREAPAAEPGEPKQMTLIDAQQVVAIERGRKLRMENDVMRGKLIGRSKVVKEAFEAERIVREAMLNMPIRIAGELEHRDAASIQLRLDSAVREALNAGADALEASVNE